MSECGRAGRREGLREGRRQGGGEGGRMENSEYLNQFSRTSTSIYMQIASALRNIWQAKSHIHTHTHTHTHRIFYNFL